MTVKEIASKIIELNITDKFCKSLPECEEDCLHGLECCVEWLNEEVGRDEKAAKSQ